MHNHKQRVHKYIRDEDTPEHTIFVIITDGQENDSHKYSSKEVKRMVNKQKEYGWEFIFLGANIDAVSAAADIGISEDRAVNYTASACGTASVYEAMSDVASSPL